MINRKEIMVGGTRKCIINCDSKTAHAVLNKIVEWMEHEDHSSAIAGDLLCQNDECQIDAPELIADIIDDILQPESVDEDKW